MSTSRKASKKDLVRHTKKFDKDLGHFEGTYWCNCRVRKYRSYLALKLYGKEDIKESSLQHYLA